MEKHTHTPQENNATPAGSGIPLIQPEKNPGPDTLKAEDKARKTSTSRGEKLFDILTYGGISFMGVFVATMPWTYWTKHGGGKKFHDWMTKGLTKRGVSEAVAEQTFNTAVLGSLGNAAIIPVKVMENYKPQIVEKLNDMLGDKSQDASVAEDPKQTWMSLIKGRVAAYTAVFVSLQGAVHIFGGDKFAKFEEKFAEHVVLKPLGKTKYTPGMAHTVANETKAFRYGKIAALDVFATGAATILLYLGSRFFAKKNEHWSAPQADADLKNAPTPSAPEPTNSAAQETAAAMQPNVTKLFTETIQPKVKEPLAPQAQPASYTETVTSKRQQQENTPVLSA